MKHINSYNFATRNTPSDIELNGGLDPRWEEPVVEEEIEASPDSDDVKPEDLHRQPSRRKRFGKMLP